MEAILMAGMYDINPQQNSLVLTILNKDYKPVEKVTVPCTKKAYVNGDLRPAFKRHAALSIVSAYDPDVETIVKKVDKVNLIGRRCSKALHAGEYFAYLDNMEELEKAMHECTISLEDRNTYNFYQHIIHMLNLYARPITKWTKEEARCFGYTMEQFQEMKEQARLLALEGESEGEDVNEEDLES